MNELLKTIIIEDNEVWMNKFENSMEAFPFIKIVDTCKNRQEGIKSIQEHNPDLVLLDIELPEPNEGFLIIDELGVDNINFDILIATAHKKSEYVNKFGDLNTLLPNSLIRMLFKEDFDLEPSLLAEQLKIILENRKNENHSVLRNTYLRCLKSNMKNDDKDKLLICEKDDEVVSNSNIELIRISDIIYFQAIGNYARIFTLKDAKNMIRYTISALDSVLTSYHFIRIHKSYLVNSNYIQKVIFHNKEEMLGSGGEIWMQGQGKNIIKLPIARPRKKIIVETLRNLDKGHLIV